MNNIKQMSITGKKYTCSIIKLKVGDFEASTIEPKSRFKILKGKNTETTAEYFSSASDTSRTESVLNK